MNVDLVTLYAAQRYSVVVRLPLRVSSLRVHLLTLSTQLTANQTVGNYWIRADPSTNEGSGFANGINSAILRYKGAPAHEPNSTQTPSRRPLVETDLRPLTNPAAVSASCLKILRETNLIDARSNSLESPNLVGLTMPNTSKLISTLYVHIH